MFNWLTNLFKSKRESMPLSQINECNGVGLGLCYPPSVAGVTVNETTILALGTLWRGARVISEAVGNLPLKLFQQTGDTRTEARTHKLWKLIHRRPNPRFSTQDFWTQLIWWSILYGHGAALIERQGADAVQLNPVHPQRLTYNYSDATYRIDNEPVHHEDLILINGPSPDGSLGFRLCQIARDSLGYFIGVEQYGAYYFGNNCDAGGWMTLPPDTNDEAATKFIESLQNRNRGVQKAGEVGVIEYGTTYTPNQRNNENGQFHETRTQNAIEICKFIGVDPVLCFEYGRATWANSTEGKRNFLSFTLNTYLNKIESELHEKVILPSEQDTIHAEFTREALLEMDTLQQAQIWALGVQNQWLEPNEVRSFLNLSPLAKKPEPAPAQVQVNQVQGGTQNGTA